MNIRSTRLIILMLTIFEASAIFAEMGYDQSTDRYYSRYAKHINQDEYNSLVLLTARSIAPRYLIQLSANEIAMVFVRLRAIGTPAALQLIADIELIFKNIKKDAKRIENL